MSAAVGTGTDAVRALDPLTLYLWMAIYYGILFKEIALPADRARPQEGPIVDPAVLAELTDLHHVLRAARQRVRPRPC